MTRVRGGGWVESSVALAKQSLTWQMVLGLCFCVPPSLSWLINGVHYIRPSPWPSCDSIFWFDSDYPFREMVPHFGHRLPNYIDTSCHLSLQSHAEAMLESPFNLHVFAWWQKAGAPRDMGKRCKPHTGGHRPAGRFALWTFLLWGNSAENCITAVQQTHRCPLLLIRAVVAKKVGKIIGSHNKRISFPKLKLSISHRELVYRYTIIITFIG